MGGLSIRPATRADLPVINDIYNYYVAHSTCTYQEEPSTMAEREQWFAGHGAELPITIAEVGGAVVGWGSLSRFHARSAYRRTVENSVYVDHRHHRRGIGSALLGDLIDRATSLDHHTIIALIDADQPQSIALHLRYGFEQVAYLKQVGFKFGRWLDVVYLQKML